jgi:D-threo-aldose 1-dehydrogenase
VRQVRLHDGATTTQLGYGCASLMGRLDRKASLRLLDAAYDAGIRHYDVARSYGYGKAEQVVGEFWRRHHDITVTTKCGITPPPDGLAVRLKPLLRMVSSAVPPLRSAARARAARMVTRGAFDPAQTQASLDRSLAALGTDRVDLLLLHECAASDLTAPLLDWLQAQVTSGRIGSFGTATGTDVTQLEVTTAFARVIQVPHTLARPGLPDLDPYAPLASLALTQPQRLGSRGVIVHSVLGDLPRVREVLERDTDLRDDVSALAATVTGDPENLGALVLAATAEACSNAVVLFASRRPERIAAGVRAVETGLPAGGRAIMYRLTKAVAKTRRS